MTSEDTYQTFLSFNDADQADFVFEKLKENNIEGVINKVKPILDKAFVDTSIDQNIIIKLRPQDFPRANEVLNEYYSTQVDNVDRDYFLFSFSDKELNEIVTNPDEWGHFNFQLAKKILKDRGL